MTKALWLPRTPKNVELVKCIVDGTDWALLKKQKMALVNITYGTGQRKIHKLSKNQIDHFTGVINWIESIQDKIVELGFKTEEQVFCTKKGS